MASLKVHMLLKFKRLIDKWKKNKDKLQFKTQKTIFYILRP